MGPSTCSLDARLILGVFDGAWAWVLELVLGVDARRVLGEHQGIQHSLNVKITAPKMQKRKLFSPLYQLTKKFSIDKVKHQK